MNFFEQQEQSKKKSFRLIILFILANLGILLSVYVVTVIGVKYYVYSGKAASAAFQWFDPLVFAWVFIITKTIIFGGSFIKIMALRKGGQYVAESLGGRLVNPSSIDPQEKKLVNVVEEMAIASGISVPMVYVMDNEDGINAFAAGYGPDDAAVSVTKGCLEKLNRDELQGVIGHEFSHILNGDMRLNIRLIGFISGIMILATVGYYVLRSGGRSRKGSGPVILMGLSLLVIGYIGVFFARLIQSAVSRQREYLADASSVQFTRNPSGLANALKKIGGFARGSLVRSHLAPEASHMFFGQAVNSFFATHPPLLDRIRKIDPSFTGDFSSIQKIDSIERFDEPVMGFAQSYSQIKLNADNAVNQVGTVSPDHVDFSTKLLESVPVKVRKELTDPLGALSVILALLLDDDADQKNIQIENLKKIAPDEVVKHTLMIHRALSSIDPKLRLPIADLSMPSLRRMSHDQFERFKQYTKVLIETDAKLSLFEFALQQVMNHRLTATFTKASQKQVYKSIEPLIEDAINLISKLAIVGSEDKTTAQKAFKSALGKLSMYSRIKKTPVMRDIPFNDLGVSIARIAAAKPGIKEAVFDACATCVLFDRIVSVEEAELLRAIAYCLDLPMAPFLGDAA